MTLKRKSLAELQMEDEMLTKVPEAEALETASALKKQHNKTQNKKSEKIFPKSEFIKMSITVEPDIFEAIEDLSRQRRRSKEPFTFSAIVRDALRDYLSKPGVK